MEAVWSALIAIAGTLLGSVSTFAFQRAATDRAERSARHERRRQERLAVYAEFASAATTLRSAAYDRWHRYQDDPRGAAFLAARDEYYRAYDHARGTYTKLRLLTHAPQLVELADDAIEQVTEIKGADTEPERAARGARAKEALDAFLSAAAKDLE